MENYGPNTVRLDLLIQQEQLLNLPGPSYASYCTSRRRKRLEPQLWNYSVSCLRGTRKAIRELPTLYENSNESLEEKKID